MRGCSIKCAIDEAPWKFKVWSQNSMGVGFNPNSMPVMTSKRVEYEPFSETMCSHPHTAASFLNSYMLCGIQIH
jgi:hypothetical protein